MRRLNNSEANLGWARIIALWRIHKEALYTLVGEYNDLTEYLENEVLNELDGPRNKVERERVQRAANIVLFPLAWVENNPFKLGENMVTVDYLLQQQGIEQKLRATVSAFRESTTNEQRERLMTEILTGTQATVAALHRSIVSGEGGGESGNPHVVARKEFLPHGAVRLTIECTPRDAAWIETVLGSGITVEVQNVQDAQQE